MIRHYGQKISKLVMKMTDILILMGPPKGIQHVLFIIKTVPVTSRSVCCISDLGPAFTQWLIMHTRYKTVLICVYQQVGARDRARVSTTPDTQSETSKKEKGG